MLKPACITFGLILCALVTNAQNLVLNPGFEDKLKCPYTFSQVDSFCNNWYRYTKATPDYHHSCSNASVGTPLNFARYQAPLSGAAYIGLHTHIPGRDYAEYILGKIQPVVAGHKYVVSMSVSLSDSSRFAIGPLGVFFFRNGSHYIDNYEKILHIIPQVTYSGFGPITDKINWVKLREFFTADSAYDNIVIGVFNQRDSVGLPTPSGTYDYAYYYVDDVSIKEVSLNLDFPDSLCLGDKIESSYSLTDGLLEMHNTGYLQLSDTNGSFTGNITSLGNFQPYSQKGSMQVSLPGTLPYGNKYRLRIVFTSPADTYVVKKDIMISPVPEITATSNSPLCFGTQIILSADSFSAAQYNWTGPNNFSSEEQNPVIDFATASNAGDYIVSANLHGCQDVDTVTVHVTCNVLDVPSAFSPNGDGHNDILYIKGSEVTELTFKIFNRWGQLIFETHDMNTGWDGAYKNQQQGNDVVAYTLYAKFKDGQTFSKKGNITIIR